MDNSTILNDFEIIDLVACRKRQRHLQLERFAFVRDKRMSWHLPLDRGP